MKAALAHVQFETIHPFLDGNGRLGRLLITLLLCAEGILSQPLLYLSLHFKEHRSEYYRLLQEVRLTGDWEAWLEFFLQGVVRTAESATLTAKNLLELFQRDRELLQGESGTVLRLHAQLQQKPVLSVSVAAKELSPRPQPPRRFAPWSRRASFPRSPEANTAGCTPIPATSTPSTSPSHTKSACSDHGQKTSLT